ncbi:hypothetical protein ACFFX0_08815 [Citricoccus parietis]|uniref:Uncharacterized protein n=1 Tax=Citricoccus parietis TaxID=592307 RepID=A0ABV5FX74_9MICC
MAMVEPGGQPGAHDLEEEGAAPGGAGSIRGAGGVRGAGRPGDARHHRAQDGSTQRAIADGLQVHQRPAAAPEGSH